MAVQRPKPKYNIMQKILVTNILRVMLFAKLDVVLRVGVVRGGVG